MWYFCMTFHAIQSTIHCILQEQSWLTRVYVMVNAFRSIFPVKVTERQCFTLVSSPLIDRTLSTISELCFAKQLSDSLYTPTWILLYAWSAELCCWFAVLTKNNLFHVYEEYLWFLIGYNCAWYAPRPSMRGVAMAYCVYMMSVDIPMYAVRYLEQDPVPLVQGILDMNTCTRTHDFGDEQVWRTLYFVGGSQASIYLDNMY